MPTPLFEIPIAPWRALSIVDDAVWCNDTETEKLCAFALDTGKRIASIEGDAALVARKLVVDEMTVRDHAGKKLRALPGEYCDVRSIDRGGRLGVGSDGGDLVVWNLATGKLVHQSPNGGMCDIEPGGSQILVTRAKQPCVLVDPKTFARRIVKASELPSGAKATWSPDGKVLVRRGTLRSLVIDVAKGVVTHKLATPRHRDACFVPGTSLYLQGGERITVLDTKRWTTLGTIAVSMIAMAVSEDGMYLATVDERGPLRIWALDRLLEGLAAPRPAKSTRSKAKPKGQPIHGVFFGVPAKMTRAKLLKVATNLHEMLVRRPPDFAMELALAPKGRSHHWFRFLGSRGPTYALEPWIESIYLDVKLPIDVVLRGLDWVRARRFDDGFHGTDITVPDDYLDAARVADPILVTARHVTVTRAKIKGLIDRVDTYAPRCFAGAAKTSVPKART